MNEKKQPKKAGRQGRGGGGVVRAVMAAAGDCQRKGDFDYQRIIVCIGDDGRGGEELARKCRVGLLRRVARKNSRRGGAVAVMEIGMAGGREALAAAVRAVNQRRAVVVLVTTAEVYGNWRGRWGIEAGRIGRRTHVVLRSGEAGGKNED